MANFSESKFWEITFDGSGMEFEDRHCVINAESIEDAIKNYKDMLKAGRLVPKYSRDIKAIREVYYVLLQKEILADKKTSS